MKGFPIVRDNSESLLGMSVALDKMAQQIVEVSPENTLANEALAVAPALMKAKQQTSTLEQQMIAQQEELDWLNYQLYGLTDGALYITTEPPPITLGERVFEISLARSIAAGESQTTWFEHHGSTPITEIPAHWPDDYKALVERRLQAITDNRWIALVEQPEYKRRWNTEPWAKRQQRALKGWLLDHTEEHCHASELQTAAQLVERTKGCRKIPCLAGNLGHATG